MTQHHFDPQNRFVIEDFDTFPAFASFLPGIAGPLGIPLWAFYVNRGQAIASFGVESKDNPIVEFQPANKAYQMTPYMGFRTFIKLRDQAGDRYYEPFSAMAPTSPPAPLLRGEGNEVSPLPRREGGQGSGSRRMFIAPNELELEETNTAYGLQTNVVYFILPGEGFAALVRQVTVKNIAAQPVTLELLDGLPAIIPFGVTNGMLKEIGRTAEAWMAVTNLAQGIPFYRVQASIADRAEVETFEAGHFFLAFTGVGEHGGSPLLFVDPTVIFGPNTALSYPDRFLVGSLAELAAAPQVPLCRTPCGFAGTAATLEPGEALTLYAIIGHVGEVSVINQARPRLADPAFIAAKRAEAQALAAQLTDAIATQTGDLRFDAYCRQAMLDNILRGGWPVPLNSHIYHLYGRRHGDLERDYNAFLLPAECYSQGNASYRDVNQNRRSDVLFNPAVGDQEFLAFLGLIQPDGYNPLTVLGSRFTVLPERQAAVLALVDQPDLLRPLLSQPFTAGSLLKTVAQHGIRLTVPPAALVEAAAAQADWEFAATFTEGYWVDHWFYNLDLLDAYLAIYPDRKDELLFKKTVPYYQGAAFVQPRERKTVLLADGKVRQYGALLEDEALAHRLANGPHPRHLVRAGHGEGEVFYSTVFAKLTGLALLKFATLDPSGLGVEMEAGKPGWCDALNGLPGLFGSSLSETYELLRLLDCLLENLTPLSPSPARREEGEEGVALPIELAGLLREVVTQLTAYQRAFDTGRDHRYWDAVATARETYRERVRLGFDGRTETIDFTDLAPILQAFRDKVAAGIARAEALAGGVPPTYFTHEAREYEVIAGAAGEPLHDGQGRPFVRVTRFELQTLPPFLEGPVHAMMAYRADLERTRAIYEQVKAGPLFDAELGMYKTNAPLADCSPEIGRLRAFTPGWLENESVFLHMAYKYLLATLRAGLRDEFFTDIRRGLVPFFDPHTYGRSPLENSSFIVSSAHPDAALHGRGYVARLTGATAEFLSMWSLMMVGPQPFCLQDGELCLAFRPVLPDWLFREDGTLTFTFLGQCEVTYRKSGPLAGAVQVTAVTLHLPGGDPFTLPGDRITLQGDTIPAPYAAMVRNGKIRRIEMSLE